MFGNAKLFLVLNRISHSFTLLTCEISWSTPGQYISHFCTTMYYLYNLNAALENS